MNEMLFETRRKADELLQQALEIWRQSDQADFLEGIEKDPVFSLLMMALAYQSNELDSEIERLKAAVLEDFAHMLIPYEMGHAIPATTVVETSLQDNLPELTLGEESSFTLAQGHPFLPLLATRVLNAEVRSVVRLDGRRWKVNLHFRYPVSDLSRFAFAVTGLAFKDLSVSIKGQMLPLVKPWDYADLPFNSCFSPDSLTYNQGQMYSPSMLPMDLFARQNIRLYSLRPHDPRRFIPVETESLDLVFEFSGIPEDFRFDKSCIFLNPVLLVNAQVREVTLSSGNPVARLAGSLRDPQEKDLTSRQFLHLIRPLDSQIFGHMDLEVRGVAGDRFNQGSLVKLLTGIITKYRTDFYAFLNLKGVATERALYQIEAALNQLREFSAADAFKNVTGVYLMPRSRNQLQDKSFSLNVKYLTTAGAAINSLLGQDIQYSSPSGFDSSRTRSISMPVPGTDELQDQTSLDSLLRYQLLTSDRIVTPADIKLFCLKELMLRYGIDGKLIKEMSVNRRLQQDAWGYGYEILVSITLAGTSFVKRNIADQLPVAEILLQKMMEVRSTNVYPIRVSIRIEEES